MSGIPMITPCPRFRCPRSPSKYIEFDQIGFRAVERFTLNWHGLGDATTVGAAVGLIGGT